MTGNKDPLDDWPYAWRTLEETLDPNLIEKHGLLHLYRSLNIGNLIAFVGSGTSLAYGRLSWSKLVEHQITLVDDALEEIKKFDKSDSYEGMRDAIKPLRQTFESLRKSEQPDAYPVVFQIGEQLFNAIGEQHDLASKLKAAKSDKAQVTSSMRPDGDTNTGDTDEPLTRLTEDYRERARRLTYDDREYCLNLLCIAKFGYKPSVKDRKCFDKQWKTDNIILSRSVPKRDQTSYYRYLHPFSNKRFRKLAKKIVEGQNSDQNHWLATCEIINREFAVKKDQIYVTPTERFLVAALLCLEPEEIKLPKEDKQLKWLSSRQSTISPDLDPLKKILMDLRITRFLTTNYDLELERLLLDRGYRLSPDEQPSDDGFRADRLDPIGGQARDMTFNASNAAELVVMAAQQSATDAFVVHLHGRSTFDSEIVVTERDYMDLYLRRDDARDLIDESITIGFSANPILFVGLGMGEADLMRPLRQFMSDQENRRNRTAVALMPINADYDESVTERVTLFMRYGVHVVHYGCVSPAVRGVNPTPWLGVIGEIISTTIRLSEPETNADQVGEQRAKLTRLINRINKDSPKATLDLDSLPENFISVPAHIDGVATAPEIYVYVELLNAVVYSVVNQHINFMDKDKVFSRLLLEGLRTAITTSTLCSRLDSIEEGWRHWWRDWQKPLVPRRPVLSGYGIRDTSDWPGSESKNSGQRQRSLARHRLQISNPTRVVSQSIAKIHEVDSSLKSSTFRQFKEAVESLRSIQTREKITQRRIYVIAAARGMGKGHFFTEFQHPENEQTFVDRTWAKGCQPQYSPSIFINLSFSSEVASVWDGLIRALEDNWINCVSGKIPVGSENSNGRQFAHRQRLVETNVAARTLPRPVRLRRALKLQSECHGERTLIAINAIDLLFKSDGKAKNTEIRRVFRELCGPQSSELPFDLVVIGNEHRLPNILRENGPINRDTEAVETLPVFYVFKGATVTARDPVERRRESSQIRTAQNQTADYNNFVQFPEPFRAHDFLLDRFPRLALLFVFDWNLRAMESTSRPDNHQGLSVHKSRDSEQLPVFVLPPVDQERLESEDPKEKFNQNIQSYLKKVRKTRNQANTLSNKEFEIDLDDPTFYKILRDNYDESQTATRIGQWDSLMRAFNNNRFILTVLLRAADYLAERELSKLPRGRSDLNDSKQVSTPINKIVKPVETFMTDTVLHALAASTGRREEVVLSDVLDCYEQYHKRGNARLDILLHLALLRHLAVVGQPTGADVLALAPEVRKYLDEYYKVNGKAPSFEERVQTIETGLEALTDRCLSFRIVPVNTRESPIDSNERDEQTQSVSDTQQTNIRYRYTLHRLTQRHVFRKMDGPLVEFAETNEYAVSLYAAQPSDLPRPTIEAYRFLRDLVNGLTDYPERSPWIDGYAPARIASVFERDSSELKVRALRAAIAVIRSIFSIAVVSRFREYDDFVDVPSKPGYLAEHRLQIRWLLKRAQQLLDERHQVATGTTPLLDNIERSDAPFYLDEIVWLYNECGVIALVQGNMSDSVALLRQALETNQRAEGKIGYGAQGSRIALNLSIAQIERANLRSAERRLNDIHNTEGEDQIVKAIALGYLGLIKQLGGSHTSAGENYEKAIDVLLENNHMRAASIFYRHWGDSLVISSPSESGVEDGVNKIKQAVACAQTGGHEDMRQIARLALIRARTRKGGAIKAEISNQIADIEGYAQSMEMPRLECEALHLRARILAKQGEQRLAGLLISRSIAIATRNDLRLRKITAMSLYGRILISRGLHEQGKHVATVAMDLARRAGYQIAIEKSERALRSLPPGQMDHAVRTRLSQSQTLDLRPRKP